MSAPTGSDAETSLALLAGEAADLPFLAPARLGAPSAWYGHVPFAHWLVGAARPRAIVELGTHNGVSYAAWCEAVLRLGLGARCTAIDTWQGDAHAGEYGDEVLDDLRRFHDPRYASFSELLRSTFDDARRFVADDTVDLLHIDGLHTYEAVRGDWETWRSALTARGVVLFHDTNEHRGSFGVWRLWDELRRRFPSFTFLHGHGLGVLAVGADAPAAVLRLCALADVSPEAARVRQRFALLGERWDVHQEQADAIARYRREAADGAGLRGELAAASVERAGLREALDDAGRRLAEADRRLDEADHVAIERDELREDLDAGAERAASLAHSLAAAHGERDHLVGELAFRASEWERIHQFLAAREEERAALQRHHDALLASTSWRVSRPLRSIAFRVSRLPPPVRRALSLLRDALSGARSRKRALARVRGSEIEALRRSPLFDRDFYAATHPELAGSGQDPVAHFVWVGAEAGAFPNAAFDTGFYRAGVPGLAESGRNPLVHWIETGRAAGLPTSPLFDRDWYAARHPDAAGDPLAHLVAHDGAPGIDPNPLFDGEIYALAYPEARATGLTALQHWVTRGAAYGLDPNPLFDHARVRARHGLAPGTDPLAWVLGKNGAPWGFPASRLLETERFEPGAGFVAAETPVVSVIVPVWGHVADSFRCLASVQLRTGDAVTFEVLVADDRPDLRTGAALARRFPGIRVIENPENLGFLRSCNEAAAAARGQILVFLNNDTEVGHDWLAPLAALIEARPRAGMVGCKLLEADGTVQEAGGSIGRDGWGVPHGKGADPAEPGLNFVREVDVVVGACFAVRREAWDDVGGFDDAFAPAFYEEFDLAFALRAKGWQVLYQPASELTHLGSNSYGAEARDRQSVLNHARFCRKWAAELARLPEKRPHPLRFRARPQDGRILLFVDDRVPEWDRHAGALTNRQYIGLWQSLGFHVVFVPMSDTRPIAPYTATLQQEGVEILHAPVVLEEWLAENGAAIDLVWTARPDVTARLLPMLRARTRAPILYYPHDLHHLRERRRFELEGVPEARDAADRYRRVERRIFEGVDRVLAISDTEADAIRALAPGADVRLVPPYLYPEPPPSAGAEEFGRRDILLFVGGYAHLPNVDAARWLVAEIMPLVWREEPGIRLVLAGASPPAEVRALAGRGVEVPGFLADLAPLTARARISVNPLRYGAGVKGKVVAALWDGLPVVATAVANEGIGLVDGVDGSLADDAAGLAAAIVALWRDPARCAAYAAAGRDVVRRRFTLEAATQIMVRLATAGRRRETLSRTG